MPDTRDVADWRASELESWRESVREVFRLDQERMDFTPEEARDALWSWLNDRQPEKRTEPEVYRRARICARTVCVNAARLGMTISDAQRVERVVIAPAGNRAQDQEALNILNDAELSTVRDVRGLLSYVAGVRLELPSPSAPPRSAAPSDDRLARTDPERKVLRAMHSRPHRPWMRDELSDTAVLSRDATGRALRGLEACGDVVKLGKRGGASLTEQGKVRAQEEVDRHTKALGRR
jgi:hypothetical protein